MKGHSTQPFRGNGMATNISQDGKGMYRKKSTCRVENEKKHQY